MPRAKCPKCVNLSAICEHREVSPDSYRFILKCEECSSFNEQIRKSNKSDECFCPFCGGIEKPIKIEK